MSKKPGEYEGDISEGPLRISEFSKKKNSPTSL